MKTNPNIVLQRAAADAILLLREVHRHLTGIDPADAVRAVAHTRNVVAGAVDTLRVGLKARDKSPRQSKHAINLWDLKGPAATGPQIQEQRENNERTNPKYHRKPVQ